MLMNDTMLAVVKEKPEPGVVIKEFLFQNPKRENCL